MRKFLLFILFLFTVLLAINYFYEQETKTTLQAENQQEEVSPPKKAGIKPVFIKAVHYFSSSWPIAFWGDFERSQVDQDFDQIKADGFNTVILVIPWMGFELGFEDGVPEPSFLYDRLEWLLTKIDEKGLNYGIRISFPHSFDPAVGTRNRELCTEVFTNGSLREQWHQYVERLARRVDQHRDSFKFAFFSWEDFFCPYVSIPAMDGNRRLEIAKLSGYQEWLAKHYPKHLVETYYRRPFDSLDKVPVPERESPAFWFFMRFVDQFLIDQLVVPGRQVLPELAMEVRVDKELIHDGDDSFWMEHYMAITDDQLRGSYWAPYYGAENVGELLTAEKALRHFEYMLNNVTGKEKNIDHIVEQFNFVDNTPSFAGHHAQIEPAELPTFLEGSADLLKQKSRGYGLWAYRGYTDSAIYNSSFELGLRGWDVQGESEVLTNDDGDQALKIQPGGEISQTFAPYDRFVGLTPSEEIKFCANFRLLADPARVTLLLDDTAAGMIDVNETAYRCTTLESQPFKKLEIKFSITSDTKIQIDDLRLYSYVQTLGVYDEHNQPGPARDLIVRLNNDWLSD